jgi:hypothetical protein
MDRRYLSKVTTAISQALRRYLEIKPAISERK